MNLYPRPAFHQLKKSFNKLYMTCSYLKHKFCFSYINTNWVQKDFSPPKMLNSQVSNYSNHLVTNKKVWALVALCCNPSCGMLLFGQMEHRVQVWFTPDLKKGDLQVPVHIFHHSATLPGRWNAQKKTKPGESLATETDVEGKIFTEKTSYVFNLVIIILCLFVLSTFYSVNSALVGI